jgi:hypothetical protein
MANSVYLTRFSFDFKNEIPIPIQEWKDCAKYFGFEFKQNENDAAIEFYCEELAEMIPLFWINEKDGEGEMKEGSFFNFGIEERFLIAQYLKALIIPQETHIIFICNCGDLFDIDSEHEPIKLYIDDLIDHEILLKDDMKQTIMDLNFIVKQAQQKAEHAKQQYSNQIKNAKPWWRFW